MTVEIDALNLSVVVPAYNCEGTIAEAVRSAWEAGAQDVLVVDDGSADATAHLAEVAGARVVHQDNSGAAAARLLGLQEVQAEYVVMLDADDRLVECGVRALVGLLQRSRELIAAVGGVVNVGPDGATFQAVQVFQAVDAYQLLRVGFAPSPPGAIVWRSEMLRVATARPPESLGLRYAEDYELLLRGSLVGKVGISRVVALEYTVGGGKSFSGAAAQEDARAKIQHHYAALLGVPIRQWTKRRAAASRRIKRARAARARGRIWSFGTEIVFATILDPGTLRRAFWWRLRARVGHVGSLRRVQLSSNGEPGDEARDQASFY